MCTTYRDVLDMFDEYSMGDPEFWHEPDVLLADLVSGFVNKGGMELGITLFVKGLVITGVLVAEQEYLKSISSMFATQAKRTLVNPTKQEIQTTEEVFDFTGLAEDVDLAELYGERDEESDGAATEEEVDEVEKLGMSEQIPPAIRHLHLKDPVIIQPAPPVSFSHSQLPILRIKLTAIDGWMVGKVNLEESQPPGFPPISPTDIRH